MKSECHRALRRVPSVVSMLWLTQCTLSHDVRGNFQASTQAPARSQAKPTAGQPGPPSSRIDAGGRAPTAGIGGSGRGSVSAAGASGSSTTRSEVDAPLGSVAADVPHSMADCAGSASDQLPDDLACTGLYEDIRSKQLAQGVQMYRPAAQLWSDGAEKTRWIYLPEDEQIDTSDPDEWTFPVGTKLFKEFQWQGKRAETRIFWKIAERRWLRTAYQWNDDETRAKRFGGGDVRVGGDSYYIPSAKECDQCHKGRSDNVLGFDAVLLSLPGADGVTLSQLLRERRLSQTAELEGLALADDGSGHAAFALSWLHANCGISCHNGNSAAEAFSTGLRFRLSVADLHAATSANSDALATSVGVAARTPRWSGWTRLVPGSPDDSLLYFLMSTRQVDMPRDQMPPIATRVVPLSAADELSAWIASLPPRQNEMDDAAGDDAGIPNP